MERKMVIKTAIMMVLLLIGVLMSTVNIQPVRASGTIYIRADGSIDPPTAPEVLKKGGRKIEENS